MMRLNDLDITTLVVAATICVSLFFSAAVIYVYTTYPEKCAIAAEVGSCTETRCRVRLESGQHVTIDGPAMVGDRHCWKVRR
jgi:hypothetical protein